MEKNKNYHPINCSQYDFLEMYAVQKRLLNISLTLPDGTKFDVKSRIVDLKAINGEEFMFLENGEKHRLDFILSLTPEN